MAPHLKRLIDLGHDYGLKVMTHCCGGFALLIPVMIEIELDRLQALQPWARDVAPGKLKAEFGDFEPYLDAVFEAFGPERIMFGSDWPVCTVAGTYAQVAGIVAGYVENLSEGERAAVWGGTATKFYGLEAQ